MDIPALSMQMASAKLGTDIGVALLSKSLDMTSVLGDSLVSMLDASVMEQSVTPHLGGSIDISI